ncbi:MAG: DUF6015 family protein [Thermoplasmata archaeon]
MKEDEDLPTTTSAPSLRDCDEVVTLQDMRLALRAVLGSKGMSDPETDKLADYLMNFFGFEDCMIDNVLEAEDRDVFYTLEEEGLLRTEREEIYLLKGKMWRIHYWILRKKEILALARDRVERGKTQMDNYALIYDQVDDEVWASRSSLSDARNGLH